MKRVGAVTGFALWLRACAYFRSPPRRAWLAFVAILAILHGLGLSYVLGEFAAIRPGTADSRSLVLTAAILIIWLAPFIPSYQKTAEPVPAFHPVGCWERALIGALWDIVGLPILALALFFAVLVLAASEYHGVDFFVGLIVILAAAFIQRSGRLLIDYRAPRRVVNILVAGALSVFLLRAVGSSGPAKILLAAAPIAALAIAHHLWLAAAVAHHPTGYAVHRRSQARPDADGRLRLPHTATWLVLQTRRLRTPLLIGIALKSLVLFFLGPVVMRPEAEPVLRLLLFVMMTPFVIFTYALNNAFGYLPQLWETAQLHSAEEGVPLRLYGQLLRLPALADALLTLVAAAFLGLLEMPLALFYIGSLCALMAIGLWSSLLDPRRVKGDEVIRLRNSVSPWFSILGSFPVAAIAAWLLYLGQHLIVLMLGPLVLVVALLLAHRFIPRLGLHLYPRLGDA